MIIAGYTDLGRCRNGRLGLLFQVPDPWANLRENSLGHMFQHIRLVSISLEILLAQLLHLARHLRAHLDVHQLPLLDPLGILLGHNRVGFVRLLHLLHHMFLLMGHGCSSLWDMAGVATWVC